MHCVMQHLSLEIKHIWALSSVNTLLSRPDPHLIEIKAVLCRSMEKCQLTLVRSYLCIINQGSDNVVETLFLSQEINS